MPEAAPRKRPWTFVPLLYFMQAIPVTIVQEVSSIVYKDLGVSNENITRWTSLIAIPWTIKLLWGPLVDLNFTKRTWVLWMQGLITVVLALAPLLLHLPNAFAITLGTLFVAAIFSATCDIATDGFYLLALNREQQSAFVGFQSTFYRLGRLFCVGLLVWAAGVLQKSAGIQAPLNWSIVLLVGALIYGSGWLLNRHLLPKPDVDVPAGLTRLGESTVPEGTTASGENRRNILRTLSIVAFALLGYFTLNSVVRLSAHGLFLILGKPALHGWQLTGPQVLAECIQLLLCGVGAILTLLFCRRQLAHTQMGDAFGSFVRQKGIVAIFAFILFYRFGEAMVMKMAPLFLKDAPGKGGLGIGNDVLGQLNGVAGVLGIVVGGIAGGLIVSRFGLRRVFWPLVICMHLPNLLYVWASRSQPSLPALYGVVFTDQFGYGFGFAAYQVYLMTVAQRGNYRTAHYAIASGLGALCIMVAGIVSGIVQANLGYQGFFLFVIAATIPGILTLLFIPLDGPAAQSA
jgi:PAT family beta-lactamase induction signal transducer AmpG